MLLVNLWRCVWQADAPLVSAIPTGLCRPAQGCEERATLGGRLKSFQPQRGCAPMISPRHNPVGVVGLRRFFPG